MLIDTDTTPWREALVAARLDGYVYLDLLTVIDRTNLASVASGVTSGFTSGPWEFIAHLVRPSDRAHLWIRSVQQAPRIDSVADEFAAAAWHEREISEMFGIEFTGADAIKTRPLLLVEVGDSVPSLEYPLRKTTPLTARLTTPWPGVHEPGGGDASPRRARSRRALRPPGVPQAWLSESTEQEHPHERS